MMRALTLTPTDTVLTACMQAGAIAEKPTGPTMEIACQEGESAIPDTRTRADGLLTVKVFCVGVLESDQVIDESRLKT